MCWNDLFLSAELTNIEYLDEDNTNDPSLYISAITANGPSNPTVITSPNHNLQTGNVISISGIPATTPFANLNDGIFGIILDPSDPANKFSINLYDPNTGQFSQPQIDSGSGFVGVGVISVRDNFDIVSKKLNFLDEGQSIQMGYMDILMNASEPTNPGAITFNVYLDYQDGQTSNTLPANEKSGTNPTSSDLFFNQTIPTVTSSLNNIGGTKFWQRVFCPTRANFLTLEFTFSNAQMAGIEQELEVQIDAQVLWMRKAGRLSQLH